VERRQIEIERVSIAAVADQFWELAQRSKGLNLDWTSEFLLLAAELLLLKARLLLKAPSFREEEDPPFGPLSGGKA